MASIKRRYVEIAPTGPGLECLEHPGALAFLFYPGTMIEPGHYALFINSLYLAGFSVYALHLAGHGEKIKSRVRNFQHMLEQGLMAQEWILQRGASALVVGGHSQGAINTLMHGASSSVPAALFPICACLPQLPCAIEVTRFAPLAEKRESILALLKWAARFFPRLPIPLPLYLSGRKILANCRPPLLTGKGVGRISYPVEFLYSLFSCHIPEKILSPLCFIAARGDALFTARIVRESYERLSAPLKKFFWLPEGGHLAILNPWLAKFCANICACTVLSLGLGLNTEM